MVLADPSDSDVESVACNGSMDYSACELVDGNAESVCGGEPDRFTFDKYLAIIEAQQAEEEALE